MDSSSMDLCSSGHFDFSAFPDENFSHEQINFVEKVKEKEEEEEKNQKKNSFVSLPPGSSGLGVDYFKFVPEINVCKRLIGKGSYGKVFECIDTHNNTIAVKVIKKDPYDDDCTKREILAMAKLRNHPNIVGILFAREDKLRFFIGMEYLQRSLFDIFILNWKKLKPVDMETTQWDLQRIKLIFQICCAICYCHKNQIIHRDVSPTNILISPSFEIAKLADFGLCRHSIERNNMSPEVTVMNSRAPEVFTLKTKYSYPVDIWGIGCVAAQFFDENHNYLFDGNTDIEVICAITTAHMKGMEIYIHSKLPKCIAPIYYFLYKCIEYDPSNRATASTLLQELLFIALPAAERKEGIYLTNPNVIRTKRKREKNVMEKKN